MGVRLEGDSPVAALVGEYLDAVSRGEGVAAAKRYFHRTIDRPFGRHPAAAVLAARALLAPGNAEVEGRLPAANDRHGAVVDYRRESNAGVRPPVWRGPRIRQFRDS